MQFFKPLRLIFLVGLGAIILIHLYKKKLQEIEVPSITFWEDAFKTENNVKKRKINKYILLMLHLIIGMLIILSFSEPYFIPKNRNNIYTLALDSSISMNAVENGKSRMDEAKGRAEDFIQNADKNSRFNMLCMKRETSLVGKNLTKSEVENELKKIKPSEEPLNVLKAQSMINSCGENVFVFTDKDIFKGNKTIKLGGQLKDIGIVYGNFQNSFQNAYCVVKNYGNTKAEAHVALKDEKGNNISSKNLSLNPNEERKLFFNNNLKDSRHVSFTLKDEDMIEENNYYSLDEEEKKNVLLIGNNSFIEKAVKVLPYVNLTVNADIDVSGKKYDFYIVDKDNVKDVPQDKPIWWVKPNENAVKKNELIKGDIVFQNDVVSYGLNNMKFSGAAYEITDVTGKADKLAVINNKLVMYMDEKKNIYSSVDWNNISMVLSPAFPIFIDNLLGHYLKDERNYEYRDFVIGVTDVKSKTEKYNFDYISDLKVPLSIIVLCLLIVEWVVFKHEYGYKS